MPIGLILNEIFYKPILNVLVLIIKGLELLHIPGELGISIIILTILIRLLTWPIVSRQIKSARKMADLKPHLDELKRKHKGDKQAFASAQMALYKEHGINPAAGCLPTLLQIPIFLSLVNVIRAFVNGNEGLAAINQSLYLPSMHLSSIPSSYFLIYDLTIKPLSYLQNFVSNPASILNIPFYILLVPVITALLGFVQSKMMMAKPVEVFPSDSKKEKQEKEEVEDAMASMQGQMLYLMPLMFGYLAFQFPLGLALYYNTFTIIGIIQQYFISGWGGFEGILKSLKLIK